MLPRTGIDRFSLFFSTNIICIFVTRTGYISTGRNKNSLMKNVFKLFVVACSVLLTLAGCEKDDDFTPEITAEDLTVEAIPS